MFLVLVLLLIGAALTGILAYATITARRRQTHMHNKKEAAQLQRRADHLFKIALATQVHTPRNEIAKILLQEAIRVLDYASTLDPTLTATTVSLRECHALLASTERDDAVPSAGRDSILEFPESELIEAQLHLTEASRLLMGLEKRGLVGYEQLGQMLTDIKQAQRGLDLRLQLRQAAASIGMERTVEKINEYVDLDRDKAVRGSAPRI